MDNKDLENVKKAFVETEKSTAEPEKEQKKENKKEEKKEKKKSNGNGKKTASLVVFFVGIAAVVAGLVFLLMNLFTDPGLRDAEYLVEIGSWTRDGGPSVVWKFTEIGKGKLTTNNFSNEYDFIWSIEDNKLKIETKWLYTLNDDYTYEIDRNNKTLTLKSDNKEFKFLGSENNNEQGNRNRNHNN